MIGDRRMQDRNKNIDICRALSLLLILIYHGWVVCGSAATRFELIHMIVSLGGEIGVTAFFILSGYGIFCSLDKMLQSGEFSYWMFMKKRAVRILPQYYVSLLVVILFMDGAGYLSKGNIWNIAAHFFMIHNLFPDAFGAINGVLWTLGVTMDFYLVAILLYWGIKRWNVWFYAASVIVTVCNKAFVYKFVLPIIGTEYAFFAGRQLLTALDHFVAGMLLAYLTGNFAKKIKSWMGIFISVFFGICLIGICKFGLVYGIHTNNLSGYTWHSFLTLALMFIIFGLACVRCNYNRPLEKALLWIAKYEYGIYLWHLVMFFNLIEKAPVIQTMLQMGKHIYVYLIFIVLAVFTGVVSSKLIDEKNGCRTVR